MAIISFSGPNIDPLEKRACSNSSLDSSSLFGFNNSTKNIWDERHAIILCSEEKLVLLDSC